VDSHPRAGSNNRVDLVLEPDLEQAIGFVHDDNLDPIERERKGVCDVIYQPAGCRHHNVGPRSKFRFLRSERHPTDS
jgi:hypothetical protein